MASRKISSIPTRIYSYGTSAPITEEPRVRDQFRLAHQYRNALVEIEHRLRTRIRDAQLAHPSIGPALIAYEESQENVDDAYDELRAAKSGTAEPNLDLPFARLDAAKELRDLRSDELRMAKAAWIDRLRAEQAAHPILGPALLACDAAQAVVKAAPNDAAKAALKAAKKTLKLAMIAWRPTLVAPSNDAALVFGYDDAREITERERKAARADYSGRGLRHGAYVSIEDSVRQAANSTKRPLSFERFDGSGKIGTQLTERADGVRGMTMRELILAGRYAAATRSTRRARRDTARWKQDQAWSTPARRR